MLSALTRAAAAALGIALIAGSSTVGADPAHAQTPAPTISPVAAASANDTTPDTERAVSVVQLGDSYSSGNGAGDYFGDPDARLSHNAYGPLYVDWLNTQPDISARFTTFAHSGAKIADLRTKQIPQVPSDADLVFFTIGGNDVEFKAIVPNCFVVGFRNSAGCRAKVDAATAMLPSVATDLYGALEDLSTRIAPGAEVVIVAYPQLAPPEPNLLCDYVVLCWGDYTYDASKAVRDFGDAALAMQAGVVAKWNAAHPDRPVFHADSIVQAFSGHEPVANVNPFDSKQWINGLLQTQTSAAGTGGNTTSIFSGDRLNWFHPGTIGQAKMAAAIETQFGLTPGVRRIQAHNAQVRELAAERARTGASSAGADVGPSAWLDGPFIQKLGTTVDFDARGSVAGSAAIERYDWDFDSDGTFDRTTTSPETSWTYPAVFTGSATVTVVDTRGRSSTASTGVLISEDGDGTPAEVDNCPGVANHSQSDEDGDGVGDDCDSDIIASVATDIPGVHTLTADGSPVREGASPWAGTATLTDDEGPVVTLGSTRAAAGATIAYRATGLPAGDAAEIRWGNDSRTVLDNVTVDQDGTVSGTVTLPRSTPSGTSKLYVVSPGVAAAANILITPGRRTLDGPLLATLTVAILVWIAVTPAAVARHRRRKKAKKLARAEKAARRTSKSR